VPKTLVRAPPPPPAPISLTAVHTHSRPHTEAKATPPPVHLSGMFRRLLIPSDSNSNTQRATVSQRLHQKPLWKKPFNHKPRMFSSIYLFYNIVCIYVCVETWYELNWHSSMHECHIKKNMLHIWGWTSIHVYEEVRVFYIYSMYITDLIIFTIILNQAYGTLSFSPLKKKSHYCL